MITPDPEVGFYGEVGVRRHMPHVRDCWNLPDDDYDRDNPDGTMYGRRNPHGASCYLSGTADQEPSEYREKVPELYSEYLRREPWSCRLAGGSLH